MSQNTREMVDSAVHSGIQVRSKARLATVSNLYHMVKSLAKINAVLINISALKQAATLLADSVGLTIELDEVKAAESKSETLVSEGELGEESEDSEDEDND